MKFIGILHSKLVYNHRTQVLTDHIVSCLAENSAVLDIGCGDGKTEALIIKKHLYA